MVRKGKALRPLRNSKTYLNRARAVIRRNKRVRA